MHPPISVEQWTALRALREGAPPVFPLLATAAQIHQTTLRERASKDGWMKMDLARARAVHAALHAPPVTPAEAESQVAAMRAAVEGLGEGDFGAFLSRQLDEIRAEATRTGFLDKPKIDGLLALSRLAEKLKPPAPERVDEKRDHNEEVRPGLAGLADRVEELAEPRAEFLYEQRCRRGVA